MDYGRFRAIERAAQEGGTYRHHLQDIHEWNLAHEMATGSIRGAPDFRNMTANAYAEMYRAKGWTVVQAIRTHMGYLGPRFLAAVERLAPLPKAAWTMVPVENDWTVVLAFSDEADAQPFQVLANAGRRTAYAYHATCLEHLDSISTHGLLPNDGTRGFWPDGYEVVDRLFFCTTQAGADYYADAIERNVGPSALLRFPLPADRTHDPRTDSGDGWFTGAAVDASSIEVLRQGRWTPLRGED